MKFYLRLHTVDWTFFIAPLMPRFWIGLGPKIWSGLLPGVIQVLYSLILTLEFGDEYFDLDTHRNMPWSLGPWFEMGLLLIICRKACLIIWLNLLCQILICTRAKTTKSKENNFTFGQISFLTCMRGIKQYLLLIAGLYCLRLTHVLFVAILRRIVAVVLPSS
jgi:hypothetical protein